MKRRFQILTAVAALTIPTAFTFSTLESRLVEYEGSQEAFLRRCSVERPYQAPNDPLCQHAGQYALGTMLALGALAITGTAVGVLEYQERKQRTTTTGYQIQ